MGHLPPKGRILAIVALAVIGCLGSSRPARSARADARMPSAVLIVLSPAGELSVVPLENAASPVPEGRGLMVVSSGESEQIRSVPPTGESENQESLSFASRLASAPGQTGAGAGEGLAFATVQLDQVMGQYVVRGSGLVTPAGRVLDGRVTIRRTADEENDSDRLPATELVLRRGNRALLTIPFAKGRIGMPWAEIPKLPASLKNGLPPGEYTLRDADGGATSRFSVESEEIRQWVYEPLDQLRSLLPDRDDPLYYQVAAEHLIGMLDEFGRPQPYLTDALDLLDGAPDESLTPHLADIRRDVLARLGGLPTSTRDGNADSDLTGIAVIDQVRQLISVGRNRDALAILDTDGAGGDERREALTVLYRGVVLADSGATYEGAARDCFVEAIARLEKGRPSDLFRARNNYAGFLFEQTRDRLYNHAFQMASGVRNPLTVALLDWHEARQQWQQALRLAGRLGPGDRAAASVNLARLYASLADIIHTLDVPIGDQRRFLAGQRAAEAEARRLAQRVCDSPPAETDAVIAAVAHETLADLAFRGEDYPQAIGQAIRARSLYLDAGSLAGVEGISRLLGQCHLRNPAGDRSEALRQLRIAYCLAEILRDRMSEDEIGLGRAGFLARRAYVNQLIAELLLEDQQPAEALRFVELAKARALEDILAASGKTRSGDHVSPPDLKETLDSWPSEVASLVYSLGTQQAWVFLVDTSGRVSAHLLRDADDRPLSSRALVAQVRSLLGRTEQQAAKMRTRLLSGKGFDHRWQDELNGLYHQLIPAEVTRSLEEAKTVLIVPDHILHYFPFAALVTQRDERSRKADEMVDPRFWIEEPFSICYAPSLSSWDLLRQRPDRPITQANALGIVDFQYAPQLPGVQKDLDNFREAFGDRIGRVLAGAQAEEGRAREILREPGLLLVATHGVNTADQPLLSHLMFQPDSDSDGLLTAGELYGLPVGADLVVMSACYSGLADRSPLPGDDLFGLQRALIHSGGRAVVSGLWDVYDGTGPELMNGFFQNLGAGLTGPEALCASQRSFLRRLRQSDEAEPWLHPYFWAVYKYVGDDRVRVQGARSAVQRITQVHSK